MFKKNIAIFLFLLIGLAGGYIINQLGIKDIQLDNTNLAQYKTDQQINTIDFLVRSNLTRQSWLFKSAIEDLLTLDLETTDIEQIGTLNLTKGKLIGFTRNGFNVVNTVFKLYRDEIEYEIDQELENELLLYYSISSETADLLQVSFIDPVLEELQSEKPNLSHWIEVHAELSRELGQLDFNRIIYMSSAGLRPGAIDNTKTTLVTLKSLNAKLKKINQLLKNFTPEST